ncbi:MAG: TRAP transporter substrate-binding protein DctP [Deltaproteobacteria bacterium]|nr:TRAP transporter substrate-binding protein DctP [Deltaproteobacteria bacterium]
MRTSTRRWCASAFLFLSVVSMGSAYGQRAISVATLAPAGSTYMRVLDAANRELRRRTNNALTLRFYPGGVQGDESEVVRKMRQGRIDGAVMTGIGMGQIHRPVLAFMLPGMFPSRAGFERARSSLAPDVETQFTSQGFVVLSWGETGSPRMFSRRPIRAPSDLRLVHPWVWRDDSILPALYAEAGATGIPLQLPEVLSALQTNRVDTVVAPPLAALALQWSQSVTHVSDQSPTYGLGGIVVTRSAFNSLSADQQATVRAVITQFNSLMVRNVARDDAAALSAMTARGMQLVTLTPAERGPWTQLFERTRTRLTGQIADAAWMNRVRAAGN